MYKTKHQTQHKKVSELYGYYYSKVSYGLKLIYAFLGVVEIFEGNTSSLHRWGARTPITVSGIRFKYCHDNLSDHGKQNIKIVKNVI